MKVVVPSALGSGDEVRGGSPLWANRSRHRHFEAVRVPLDDLKKNDSVRTSGGFFGKVVSVDTEHNTVTLKIDEQNNTRLRVTRSSIEAIMSDDKKESTSDAKRATQKAEVGS